MDIVLVVAPSLSQFRSCALELSAVVGGSAIIDNTRGRLVIGNTEWRYVSEPNKMRGYHGVKVEFWGQFHLMDNLEEFKQQAFICQIP